MFKNTSALYDIFTKEFNPYHNCLHHKYIAPVNPMTGSQKVIGSTPIFSTYLRIKCLFM
ncbi:hypothetical protein DSECCO2_121480 [anaerobic digester metagenome]